MTNETGNPNRTVNARRWIAAGTAVAASIAIVAPAAAITAADLKQDVVGKVSTLVQLAASEGGEGGEGGEAGAAKKGTMTNADLLAQIGLIEGHLMASVTLLAEGHMDMAKTHVKHPGDEIYKTLEPEFKARNVAGFAQELQALAGAVGKEASVTKQLDPLNQRIEDVRKAINASDADKLKAIVKMLQTAAKEYAVGVKDGKIVDPHEYQDAWGFVRIARGYAAMLAKDKEQDVAQAASVIVAEIDNLATVFPSVMPEGVDMADPSVVYGAAARIEIAALKVK
jgi:hypothetical protein